MYKKKKLSLIIFSSIIPVVAVATTVTSCYAKNANYYNLSLVQEEIDNINTPITININTMDLNNVTYDELALINNNNVIKEFSLQKVREINSEAEYEDFTITNNAIVGRYDNASGNIIKVTVFAAANTKKLFGSFNFNVIINFTLGKTDISSLGNSSSLKDVSISLNVADISNVTSGELSTINSNFSLLSAIKSTFLTVSTSVSENDFYVTNNLLAGDYSSYSTKEATITATAYEGSTNIKGKITFNISVSFYQPIVDISQPWSTASFSTTTITFSANNYKDVSYGEFEAFVENSTDIKDYVTNVLATGDGNHKPVFNVDNSDFIVKLDVSEQEFISAGTDFSSAKGTKLIITPTSGNLKISGTMRIDTASASSPWNGKILFKSLPSKRALPKTISITSSYDIMDLVAFSDATHQNVYNNKNHFISTATASTFYVFPFSNGSVYTPCDSTELLWDYNLPSGVTVSQATNNNYLIVSVSTSATKGEKITISCNLNKDGVNPVTFNTLQYEINPGTISATTSGSSSYGKNITASISSFNISSSTSNCYLSPGSSLSITTSFTVSIHDSDSTSVISHPVYYNVVGDWYGLNEVENAGIKVSRVVDSAWSTDSHVITVPSSTTSGYTHNYSYTVTITNTTANAIINNNFKSLVGFKGSLILNTLSQSGTSHDYNNNFLSLSFSTPGVGVLSKDLGVSNHNYNAYLTYDVGGGVKSLVSTQNIDPTNVAAQDVINILSNTGSLYEANGYNLEYSIYKELKKTNLSLEWDPEDKGATTPTNDYGFYANLVVNYEQIPTGNFTQGLNAGFYVSPKATSKLFDTTSSTSLIPLTIKFDSSIAGCGSLYDMSITADSTYNASITTTIDSVALSWTSGSTINLNCNVLANNFNVSFNGAPATAPNTFKTNKTSLNNGSFLIEPLYATGNLVTNNAWKSRITISFKQNVPIININKTSLPSGSFYVLVKSYNITLPYTDNINYISNDSSHTAYDWNSSYNGFSSMGKILKVTV